MYAKKDVKKIEKTIGEYIDYCDEITEKVAKKEKGYKANLMKPDFDVLKKAILESETTCP
jgi:t-SNARE complex subunit (syntaxin)